jgi:signal transduction histidine kinase
MKSGSSIVGKGLKHELHDSNSFFERVAMSGPGLSVVISGADSTIHFANSMFVDYMGFSKVVLEGRQFTSFLEAYQRERFYSHLQEVRYSPAAGNSFVIYNLRNSAGISTPVYLYASKVLGDNTGEEEMYHLFMLLDRSKWGMPFTSFETRELFLELFNAEGFGTFEWIVDVDKIFWSTGVYNIHEVDIEERSLSFDFTNKFIHPLDRVRVTESVQQALKNLSDLNIEYRIITAKNNLRLLHCLGRVIKDKNGKAVNLAGSVRDITSQRSIENNLKEMVDELHRSNKELEEFAYAASHDLQEPLRKITTFSDRLLEKYKNALAGEGEMYLSRMVASAENMRLLINGLLDFSRISQTSAPFVPVSLDHLLMEVMNDLELKIEETGTAIRCTGLPEVDAVGSQMKQLFQNLLSNAIKFHKPGVPPIIRIEQEEVAEGELARHNLYNKSKYYKIVFTDNGIGFEKEYAGRIFQVFQRLHGKSEYPGSGIGLAICKKILEYHHGLIYAESLPGKGARFVILIPERQ